MSGVRRGVVAFSVAAAALGYFVDLFDIVIFGVVRVASLTDLGLKGQDVTDWGILLLNLQMLGMLVGGFAWGLIGDRFGRRFTLLATIFVFSAANIANAHVTTVGQYAVMRFIAGFGLAGELGAGVTLVSELLPRERRGYATTIISFLGLVGALTASWIGSEFSWRNAYFIGGVLGLAVMQLRFIGMAESELFEKSEHVNTGAHNAVIGFVAAPLIAVLAWLMFGGTLGAGVPKELVWVGLTFALLIGFATRWRDFLAKFFGVALVGVPIWYVSALFVNLAPEFGKSLPLDGFDPKTFVATVLAWQASGLAIGSALTGVISEWVGSRKRVLWVCLLALAGLVYGMTELRTATDYVHLMFVVGLFQGYWTVFITTATEQFGTDVRATVASSVPNIVRAMTVPVTLSVKGFAPDTGWTQATVMVGAIVFGLALLALARLAETYGKNLDYTE